MEIEPPLFIFVTAYSEHAVRAFEAEAIDYLVKPVEEDRLADAIDRVRKRLLEKRGGAELEKLKNVLRAARSKEATSPQLPRPGPNAEKCVPSRSN